MSRRLACARCGRRRIVAHYDVGEHQGIVIQGVSAGAVVYDYDGVTGADDAIGPDLLFSCADCGAESVSLERLLGLPSAPRAGVRKVGMF